MTQLTLDLDTDNRTGNPSITHVLMPNMAYACGGSILTKRGSFKCGTSSWKAITCPDCKALGKAALTAEIAGQQGRQEAGK